MRKIDETKLAKLSTTNKMLDDKYGTHGTETRNEFDEQSLNTLPSSLNFKLYIYKAVDSFCLSQPKRHNLRLCYV